MLKACHIARGSQVEQRTAVGEYHRVEEAAYHSHHSARLSRVWIDVAAVPHAYGAESQQSQRTAAEHEPRHGVVEPEARLARVFHYV